MQLNALRMTKWLMIDLEKLKLLLAVVDAGAISKAAVYRGVPQSNVSRQIASIEREYGGHLLTRNGRGVQLTEFGVEVLPQIRELVLAAERLETSLREESRVVRGEVRVGILTTFVGSMAARLWSAVAQQLPEVQLKILEGMSGQLEEWVASGRTDVSLVLRSQGSMPADIIMPASIVFHVVGRKGSRPVSRPTISLAELATLPLVLPGQQSSMRTTLEQTIRKRGLQLNVALETDSFLTQLHVAATGGAYAVLGPFAMVSGLATGRTQSSRLVEPEIRRDIGLAFTTVRPASSAAREVARIMRGVVIDVLHEIGANAQTDLNDPAS
ncbi:LysR family transcriptional regulator [Hydrogenophaga sp.]|uniref:LysR family transcriptional regulator n=1 Tax=Hydrogenophaga sp. TaxID=1904254 RepID=UPI00261A76CF|nr:LysR family transcriptional regulator [Hydrogenophaga sp.]MCW5654269.1 LysR family transcriptional regulator [Hydrogenophaga sp.]